MSNDNRIYWLNVESDQAELKRLAAEGGHSVWVRDATIYMDAPLRLHNLRLDKGCLTGDAKLFIPDTEPPTPVASA